MLSPQNSNQAKPHNPFEHLAHIAVKRLGDVMSAPTEPMTLIPTLANINQATNITLDSLGFR